MQGTKSRPLSAMRNNKRVMSNDELPIIPDKRYFTIGEVSSLCAVKPHVLRYWEQEFSQIQPGKRRGNRRSYQYSDVLLIRQIRKLLYEDGFTIEGARAQLSSGATATSKAVQRDAVVKKIIVDLECVLERLKV